MVLVGSALLFVYSAGKFTNGFLADRCNIARFMSTALFLSGLVNVALGFNTTFALFLGLWALNGWFQSIGSAPSVVALSHWFGRKERGTRYGIWSASHSIGERRSKSTMPEPSRIAGVMPTRRSSTSAMSHSHWPNTWVKLVLGGVAGLTKPTAGDVC